MPDVSNAPSGQIVFIGGKGLELFLGPLESACIRALWSGARTTMEVYRIARTTYQATRTDEIAFTSCATTVRRLWERGLLTRTGDKRSYKYTPVAPNEAAFINEYLERTLRALIDNFPREVGRIIVAFAREQHKVINVKSEV